MAVILSAKLVCLLLLSMVKCAIPIQMEFKEGEELKGNNVDTSHLNECISDRKNLEVGVCFGKELLYQLNNYEESDMFSLATGVSFIRDEKSPRDISSFLDKDPMDYRSIMEDASNLISKRSLQWDLSNFYPGLVMRIGPTLANGILEFVMDPRMKDRSYSQPTQSTISTGRLLARNLLVPFLLGFKFHISTLLPLLLGLLLLASKKAFILAKLALIAVTLFSTSASLSNSQYLSDLTTTTEPPTPSSYYGYYDNLGHYHSYHGSGGYHRHPHNTEYFYREKSSEQSTASPITPDELRDRLERFFITKKDPDAPKEEQKVRNARNFAWTPMNGG